MTRILTFLAGLAVVIGSGVVYGAWTQRWQKSADLEAQSAKLRSLPEQVGSWKGDSVDLDGDALALAGAESWWVRRFTDERTGSVQLVILLCGQPGHMSVHRPENCYVAAGYALTAPPIKYTPPTAPGTASTEFWTGKFKQAEAGGHELRIFWSWYDGGSWRAPDNPRWEFARLPALYKLYVIRETSGRAERLDDDPAIDLMHHLLPEISRTLSAP
jgi:Protein of unknown function (DUF3485)